MIIFLKYINLTKINFLYFIMFYPNQISNIKKYNYYNDNQTEYKGNYFILYITIKYNFSLIFFQSYLFLFLTFLLWKNNQTLPKKSKKKKRWKCNINLFSAHARIRECIKFACLWSSPQAHYWLKKTTLLTLELDIIHSTSSMGIIVNNIHNLQQVGDFNHALTLR